MPAGPVAGGYDHERQHSRVLLLTLKLIDGNTGYWNETLECTGHQNKNEHCSRLGAGAYLHHSRLSQTRARGLQWVKERTDSMHHKTNTNVVILAIHILVI
jgi:hypothetical protein